MQCMNIRVIAVLLTLGFALSTELGLALSFCLYMLPICISPILLGRLCGAFVSAELLEDTTGDTNFFNALKNNTSTVKRTAAASATSEEHTPDSIESIINDIASTPGLEVGDTIRENLLLSENSGMTATIALKLTYLHEKVGQHDKAIHYAGEAIGRCLNSPQPQYALKLYFDFKSARTQFNLTPNQLETLADHLQAQNETTDACWCFYFAIMLSDGDDKLNAQKKLLSIADQAAQQGNLSEAVTIYQLFVDKFPQSSLFDYARTALLDCQDKLHSQ